MLKNLTREKAHRAIRALPYLCCRIHVDIQNLNPDRLGGRIYGWGLAGWITKGFNACFAPGPASAGRRAGRASSGPQAHVLGFGAEKPGSLNPQKPLQHLIPALHADDAFSIGLVEHLGFCKKRNDIVKKFVRDFYAHLLEASFSMKGECQPIRNRFLILIQPEVGRLKRNRGKPYACSFPWIRFDDPKRPKDGPDKRFPAGGVTPLPNIGEPFIAALSEEDVEGGAERPKPLQRGKPWG
jgi:hypothetical protein